MAVQNYLFLCRGSSNDPGFEGVEIHGVSYKEFMRQSQVNVVDDLIMSCHSCPDLLSRYVRDMQYLAERGDRVLAVMQGGLLFGLPIAAMQTTFPIISVPTDYVSYTGFMVPLGHAVISTVGVEREGFTNQREKALTLAQRILSLEIPEVNIFANKENYPQLAKKLEGYGITHQFPKIIVDALSLVYGNDEQMLQVSRSSFAIRADSDENMMDWEYFPKGEARHHRHEYNMVPNVQVRGMDNLAIFAAKILSLQLPELRDTIKDISRKKRDSYTGRDLLIELGVIPPEIGI